MASDSPPRTSLHPAMVLGAFAEALLAGKRVAVLGDSSSGLAERLAAASGRRVHCFDPDPQRAAVSVAQSPARGSAPVSFVVLDDDLDGRSKSFDVVVVPDLSGFDDPEAIIGAAHEMMSGRGLAVFGSPNPGSEPEEGRRAAPRDRPGVMSYYDLYDAVAGEFSTVRMLGQAPFLGFTVADFAAEGEPAVSIDSSLCAGSEEPDRFVVVASHHPVDLEPYTVVQVPVASGLGWIGATRDTPAAPADAAALAEAQRRVTQLSDELSQLRERQRRESRLAEQRRSAATAASTRAAELEGIIEEHRAELRRDAKRLADMERAMATRDRRIRELDSELRERAERESELEDALATIAEREAELEALLAERGRISAEEAPATVEQPADAASVRAFEFQIGELRKTLAATRNERDALRERADTAERLERELQEAAAAQQRAEAELEKLTGAAADEETADAHALDITRLEAALRERGQVVAKLQSQVRESARVGQELLREIEAARRSQPAPQPAVAAGERSAGEAAPSGPGDVDARAGEPPPTSPAAAQAAMRVAELQHEVELLAQKCAAYQADLEAATWTIAKLEKQAPAEAEDSTPEMQKLEEALRAARSEVSQLRAQLREAPLRPGGVDDNTDHGVS